MSRVTVYVGVRAQISCTFIFSIILVNIPDLFFYCHSNFFQGSWHSYPEAKCTSAGLNCSLECCSQLEH